MASVPEWINFITIDHCIAFIDKQNINPITQKYMIHGSTNWNIFYNKSLKYGLNPLHPCKTIDGRKRKWVQTDTYTKIDGMAPIVDCSSCYKHSATLTFRHNPNGKNKCHHCNESADLVYFCTCRHVMKHRAEDDVSTEELLRSYRRATLAKYNSKWRK